MPGYSDTRQLIIDTLMNRPAGTEIQPEDHQAFALALNDYIRSVELVAGNATPIDFADASTVPVQPDNGQAVYLSSVGGAQTVTFSNFIDQNGNAISVTSTANVIKLVTLLWNGQYWSSQVTSVNAVRDTTNGYLFMGIATPATNPGTPDQKVFYMAANAGTYSNFNNLEVLEDETAIFIWNVEAWQKQVTGFAAHGSILKIEAEKVEICTVNLINPDKLLFGKYITGTGNVSPGDAPYAVTEPILVNGQDIISNSSLGSYPAIRPYVVYNYNMEIIRVGQGENPQYTYQEGDYYVRFSFHTGGTPKPQANYGNVLLPYEEYNPVGKYIKPIAESIKVQQKELDNKLDKILSTNIVDPRDITQMSYLTQTGTLGRVSEPYHHFVSGYIPVNGKDIIMTGTQHIESTAVWCVYDINGVFLAYGQDERYLYNEERRDFYIRISFYGDNYPDLSTTYANYGDELLPYQPYTEFAPLTELEQKSEKDIKDLQIEKLDKIPGVNLVDKSKVEIQAYINSGGNVGKAEFDDYLATDYIPVNGQNISSNAIAYPGTSIAAYAVYDINKTFLRYINSTDFYTYQEGDYYVRFTMRGSTPMANYGDELLPYQPYTEFAPLTELEQRVNEYLPQKKDVEFSYIPNFLYCIYNSVNKKRQYSIEIDLSHMLNSQYVNSEVRFTSGLRSFKLIPEEVLSVDEKSISQSLQFGAGTVNTTLRTTNSASSKLQTPRVLTIGDSVTSGYGASSNKEPQWLPNQYWAWAKMLFEMDKIDAGDSSDEYNAIFLGTLSNGDFNLTYEGETRNIRCRAEGKGSAYISQLFDPMWGINAEAMANPFYDEENSTFSMESYLRNYRTMDNLGVRLTSALSDPHGQNVIGSDGLTYTIGQKITSQSLLLSYDVCTPTHIFINLTHNSSLDNYKASVQNIINIIQSQLPGVPICLMTIDETGTLFPKDYPEYISSQITMGSLHTKNGNIYDYIRKEIENETNGVYLLGMQFIQPTVESYPTIEYTDSSSILKDKKSEGAIVKNPDVAGANYHPNNYAHSAWGYSMYSFLKWIMSK